MEDDRRRSSERSVVIRNPSGGSGDSSVWTPWCDGESASFIKETCVQRAHAMHMMRGGFSETRPPKTIMFADIVDYTRTCSIIGDERAVHLLDQLFVNMDVVAGDMGVEKVDTIGDAYVAVCRGHEHALRMMAFVREIVSISASFGLRLHVGLNVGPTCAAAVGATGRRISMFGDAVNVAARMQSVSAPGEIVCSEAYVETAIEQGANPANFRRRKPAYVKGKGMMVTYSETTFLPPAREDNGLVGRVFALAVMATAAAALYARLARRPFYRMF